MVLDEVNGCPETQGIDVQGFRQCGFEVSDICQNRQAVLNRGRSQAMAKSPPPLGPKMGPRVPRDRNGVKVFRPYLSFRKAISYCLCGKAGDVFYTDETFFLGCRYELAVSYQCSRGFCMVGVESEDQDVRLPALSSSASRTSTMSRSQNPCRKWNKAPSRPSNTPRRIP